MTRGAGFLGSHLCERLVEEGHDVLCIDNYFTGRRANIAHLVGRPNFEVMRHDIRQTRSFCYVDDQIEAFVQMMASADRVTGPINLGDPGEFSILELAEKVLALTDSKSELVFQSQPQEDSRQRRPDIAWAQTLLGWAPTVPLEQCLEKAIAYFDALLGANSH